MSAEKDEGNVPLNGLDLLKLIDISIQINTLQIAREIAYINNDKYNDQLYVAIGGYEDLDDLNGKILDLVLEKDELIKRIL